MESRLKDASATARVVFSRFIFEAKQFAHPFYTFNLLLSISFFVFRLIPPLCTFMFVKDVDTGIGACELDTREHEVMIFVGCVTVIKNRGAPTWQHYMKKFMLYAKVANIYLFWRQHPAYGVVYLVLCAVQMIFFPEPIYSGPEKIEYFSGLENMEKTISEDKRTTWLVCFYTTWSMKCIDVGPIFAELSGQYWLPNFRFGKIDVGRFNNVAPKYNIGTGAWTRQLPTIILFKDGQPHSRRPFIDNRRQVAKYEFAVPTLIQDLDLNNEYEACKSRLGKKALQEIAKPVVEKKKD